MTDILETLALEVAPTMGGAILSRKTMLALFAALGLTEAEAAGLHSGEMVVVPKEPTDIMAQHGNHELSMWFDAQAHAREAYKVMLACRLTAARPQTGGEAP